MSYGISFTLTGDTPLLMHCDNIEAADAMEAWRKDPSNKNKSKAGDDRSPPWTWRTYLYTDGEHVVIPSENLMVSLRQAGAQIILKKQKTFKELSQSGMYVNSEYLDFAVNGNRIPIGQFDWRTAYANGDDVAFLDEMAAAEKAGFRLFPKRAKVGQSKHIRVRPRFETWQASGKLTVLASELTFEVLQQMFAIAGRGGMCDWRAAGRTPGPYGLFEAKLKQTK